MISNMEVFQMLDALARHATEAQRVSAVNVSRAAEPGYKAQEVESFEAFLARASEQTGTPNYNTPFKTYDAAGPSAPNGNSVNIEQELFRSAEATGQHGLAISAYTKTLELMRMAVSGRR